MEAREAKPPRQPWAPGSTVERVFPGEGCVVPDARVDHHVRSSIPWHEHEHPSIFFVLAGRCRCFFEGQPKRSAEYQPGSVSFTPQALRHCSEISSARSSVLSLSVRASALRELGDDGELERPRCTTGSHALFPVARRLLAAVSSHDRSELLVIESLALELAAAVLGDGPPRSYPPWVWRVKERLDDEWSRRHSLAELAKQQGVSVYHLARTFKAAVGVPVGDYATGLRLARAMELVACTDRPLADIALESGYFDQSHMTRFFRRRLGVSPRQYRRLHRSS